MSETSEGGCGCLGLMFVSIIIPILVILALALLGPAVGNVFSNITTAL